MIEQNLLLKKEDLEHIWVAIENFVPTPRFILQPDDTRISQGMRPCSLLSLVLPFAVVF